MARNVYGLDLGSYDIKVYDKKKDTIWKEKNVIAFKDNHGKYHWRDSFHYHISFLIVYRKVGP